jgi:ABC-type transport system involved in multi-copper enzyme maturation permease subunit
MKSDAMSDPMPIDEATPGPVPGAEEATIEELPGGPAPTRSVGEPRPRRRTLNPRLALAGALSGLTAIGVKELRGRMRGRRAFVILTVYLMLLAAFAWMMELILVEEKSRGAGSAAFASAEIGAGVFTGLVMLQTLLVVVLAPAFTAGAISLEREKQTLDLLATTPISSVSIVVAKLFSALTYLFILIFASIPLTAMVFVFGGVAPDDVVKAYLVLITTAIGLGSVGLFFSALLKRTQAATVASYFTALVFTLGTLFIVTFWNSMTNGGLPNQGFGPIRGRPPEVLVYLNPYFAQADVVCPVENGIGDRCRHVALVTNRSVFSTIGNPPPTNPGIRPEPFPVAPDVGFDDVIVQPVLSTTTNALWPKSAAAWLIVSLVLIGASVQLVTPTRRWHPQLPGFLRRSRRVST